MNRPREESSMTVWTLDLPQAVITLAAPAPDEQCHALTCKRQDTKALVVVMFGVLPGLWKDVWGRSYPMCAPCWDRTRAFVQNSRPALVIRRTG
jgi:hypothetical protein